MRKYVLEIVIVGEYGADEYWEEIYKSGKTGCDQVVDAIEDAVHSAFPEAEVALKSYQEDGNDYS